MGNLRQQHAIILEDSSMSHKSLKISHVVCVCVCPPPRPVPPRLSSIPYTRTHIHTHIHTHTRYRQTDIDNVFAWHCPTYLSFNVQATLLQDLVFLCVLSEVKIRLLLENTPRGIHTPFCPCNLQQTLEQKLLNFAMLHR